MFSGLVWREGFADYHAVAEPGAMVELVTLCPPADSPLRFSIGRDGPGVERLRTAFDYGPTVHLQGIQKNERSYVERAEFEIGGGSASARAGRPISPTCPDSRIAQPGAPWQRRLYAQAGAIDQNCSTKFGRLLLGLPTISGIWSEAIALIRDAGDARPVFQDRSATGVEAGNRLVGLSMTLVARAISRRKQTGPAISASMAVMNNPAIVLGSSTCNSAPMKSAAMTRQTSRSQTVHWGDRPVNQPGPARQRMIVVWTFSR